MEKLNIFILSLSLLLIGCNKQKSISEDKALLIASGYNSEKKISKYNFIDGTITDIDSINFIDSKNEFKFKSNLKSLLTENKVVSSFGALLDLNEKKLALVDSLGYKIANKGLLLKKDKNIIYFYNFISKNIVRYDLESNKLFFDVNAKKFELQYFNSFPCIDYISTDLKHLIKVIPTGDFGAEKTLNTSFNIFLKNLSTGEENKIINSVNGTLMSTASSTISMPSVKWLNENEFIFANFKKMGNSAMCDIMKFDISNNQITTIGKIDSFPFSTSNSIFEFDANGNLFFFSQKGVFQVDIINNNLSQKIKFSLGDNFYVNVKDGFKCIYFDNEKIYTETDNEKFELFNNDYKSHKNYLALKVTTNNNDTNLTKSNHLKIWSKSTRKWTLIKESEIVSILGWK